MSLLRRHACWYPEFHQADTTSLHQFTVFARKNYIHHSLSCHCPRLFPGLPVPVHRVSADIMTFTAMTPDDAILYVLKCFPNVGKPERPVNRELSLFARDRNSITLFLVIQAPNVRSFHARPHTLNITLHFENSDHNLSIKKAKHIYARSAFPL